MSKKIVIIGNSAAGFSCLKALLGGNNDLDLTIISQEKDPTYNSSLLLDYLAGRTKEEDLFLCPQDFYDKNRASFIKGLKVSRVDSKKQAVVLKDNSKINYDYLVIASGLRINLPDIPGTNKDNVFSLYTLEDARKIKQSFMIADTVCICGEPNQSKALYEAIADKIKHIKIIAGPRPEGFISTEQAEWIDGAGISEIIGEGLELKAVKLANGKAFGVSSIIFTGNYIPNSEFLKESGINTKEGYILVDDNMRTNIENIYACGGVSAAQALGFEDKSWGKAQEQGNIAAAGIIQILERGKISCQTS